MRLSRCTPVERSTRPGAGARSRRKSASGALHHAGDVEPRPPRAFDPMADRDRVGPARPSSFPSPVRSQAIRVRTDMGHRSVGCTLRRSCPSVGGGQRQVGSRRPEDDRQGCGPAGQITLAGRAPLMAAYRHPDFDCASLPLNPAPIPSSPGFHVEVRFGPRRSRERDADSKTAAVRTTRSLDRLTGEVQPRPIRRANGL
jgi:hypothetical protein